MNRMEGLCAKVGLYSVRICTYVNNNIWQLIVIAIGFRFVISERNKHVRSEALTNEK